MADNVINVVDVAANGVVFDTSPIALATNIFTDVRNVRFKDGAIRKMEGELLLNNIAEDLVPANEKFGKIRHVGVWEHPTLLPDGCFYIWVVDYIRDNITVGQKVYAQDHLGNKKDITPPLNMVSNAVTTTATAASGATTLTVADASGITVGDFVEGAGLIRETQVSNIVGTTITISVPTILALSTTNVRFGLRNGFKFTETGWQNTLFNGGFSFIINNGLDKPHYISDNGGSGLLNDLILAELPGWDGYFAKSIAAIRTFDPDAGSANSDVFDLARSVDFVTQSISVIAAGVDQVVEAGTPAGTGTLNGTNFVPGTFPEEDSQLPTVTAGKFQIYFDKNTNTTVVYVGGLTTGQEVLVSINSRNPVTVTCGVIESFGNLLVAGNILEKDENNVISRKPGFVRTSNAAFPGAMPQNWDPYAAGRSTADDFELSDTNVIKDMRSLQGALYIYSTNGIHRMALTGDSLAPTTFSSVTDEYGVLTRGGLLEYDGKHFVIGNNDIYLFAGNPGDIQSISDSRVREYFFNNLNPIYEQNLFTLLNHRENEIWICYPSLASVEGESDEALIWNYRDNTWTVRDLNNVTSGAIGPIKGGGIPTANLALTGDSGNAGYTNRGKREVQTVTINGGTPKKTIGTKAKVKIKTGNFTSFDTDIRDVQEITIPYNSGNNNTGPVLNKPQTTFTWSESSAPTFTVNESGQTNSRGNAYIMFNGNSRVTFHPGGFPLEDPISGTVGRVIIHENSIFSNSATGTRTMIEFFNAAATYINNDNYGNWRDWTATNTPNADGINTTLTLTSTVGGKDRIFTTSGTGDSSIRFNYRTTYTDPYSQAVPAINNRSVNGNFLGNGLYLSRNGYFGITDTNSPAVSLRLKSGSGTGPTFDETVAFSKNLTTQAAIRDDILPKIQALAPFNGDSNSTYSVSASLASASSDLKLIFTATTGGPRRDFSNGSSASTDSLLFTSATTGYDDGYYNSATINAGVNANFTNVFKNPNYFTNPDIKEADSYGGSLASTTVARTTTGVTNASPPVNLAVTYPDGSTQSAIIEGEIKAAGSSTSTSFNIAQELNEQILDVYTTNFEVIDQQYNPAPSYVTVKAKAVGVINPFVISVTPLYSGSFPNDFSNSTFTQPTPSEDGDVRAGRAAHSGVDTIILNPPAIPFTDPVQTIGSPLSINFSSTAAFDPDSGSAPTNVETITATEIATKFEDSWGAGTITTTAVLIGAGASTLAVTGLANISLGASISGVGIAPGTTVTNISAPNITISKITTADIPVSTTLNYVNSDTFFTVSRTNEVLTFTKIDRIASNNNNFSYLVTPGDVRTGTLVSPLITDSVDSNTAVTVDGISPVYAKLTRFTITLQTLSGDYVLWDKHYGEGPGRILDPSFTMAANDNTYGDTSATDDAEYLNLYYNPNGDPAVEAAKDNGTVSGLLSAMQQSLAQLSTIRNLRVVASPNTASPTSLEISPTQFGISSNYVESFSPFVQAIPATVAPTTTDLVAATEGDPVATTAPTQSAAGTTIDSTLDLVRPWASTKINPTIALPIFAQFYYTNNVLGNRLRAGDLGYDFGGLNYISYFEREQVSVTPTFNTETVESISLWADGGSPTSVGGELERATLQVRARGTNFSGEKPFLISPEDPTQSNAKSNKLVVNKFVVASNHKVDTRVQGRFISVRIDDALASVAGGYLANNNKAWNISGLQLKVTQGGIK